MSAAVRSLPSWMPMSSAQATAVSSGAPSTMNRSLQSSLQVASHSNCFALAVSGMRKKAWKA